MKTPKPLAAAVAVSFAVLAGCGADIPDDPHAQEIAELTRAVESLTASNETLGKELRRQGRMLDGLRRDVTGTAGTQGPVASSGVPVDAAADGMEATAMAAAAQPGDAAEEIAGAAAEGQVGALLESEAGRKAIEKAAARELERREEQERRVFVSYTIGVFARKAGLDEHQTDGLQKVWKESLDSGAELRKDFAALRKLPEAERPEARAKVMDTMRAIGRGRNDRVRELLTEEQLELYAPAEEEIVAGLHGGPRKTAPKAK